MEIMVVVVVGKSRAGTTLCVLTRKNGLVMVVVTWQGGVGAVGPIRSNLQIVTYT
jgi:hypothetical protein